MNKQTIEILDSEINVEEVISNIRDNVLKRECESAERSQRDQNYLHENWDIHNNNYKISSHHSAIGKFLIMGRQMVHEEVRRYIDPVISKQTEFNASVASIISRTSQKCEELDWYLSELEKTYSIFQLESDKKIEDGIATTKKDLYLKIELACKKQDESLEIIRNEFNVSQRLFFEKIRSEFNAEFDKRILEQEHEFTIEVDEKIRTRVRELLLQIDHDIHDRSWLAHVLEERIKKGQEQECSLTLSGSKDEGTYFLFEERFRGSREDIKQRQLAFIPYFDKCSRVLDIGCGRGEFLEILKNHDIGGIGVDSDPDMVAYCHSRQLDVVQSDAISFLETLADKSLDGVFISQVVEHLDSNYLFRLLVLCYQKLKFGYHIVVETVNPLSFSSFVNFYIDLTHKKPVHPETLQYLLGAAGFRECEKKFFSPISEESRLKKIEEMAEMNATERKNVGTYNHNVEILNSVLFGAQDYAVIGKK